MAENSALAALILDRMQLETEQEELLVGLVEASRSVPRDKRLYFHSKFIGGERVSGPNFSASAAPGDVEHLQATDLLRVLNYQDHGGSSFIVSPDGYEFYEQRMKEAGKLTEQVEEHMGSYFDGEAFLARYPTTHRLCANAASRMWSADAPEALTSIGHTLREAMQAFAGELAERSGVTELNPDPSKTLDRVSAVIKAKRPEIGDSAADLLDAAFGYWRALNGIIQRQEHGGGPTWEDGRRAVFNTMFVMTELDRTL